MLTIPAIMAAVTAAVGGFLATSGPIIAQTLGGIFSASAGDVSLHLIDTISSGGSSFSGGGSSAGGGYSPGGGGHGGGYTPRLPSGGGYYN